MLLLTDRADHALTAGRRIEFLGTGAPRMYFPEPNPLFYEQAAWGTATRRDRLQALTLLAAYHIPGAAKPEQPPIIVASVRAVMTRTLPRRDFLKASRTHQGGAGDCTRSAAALLGRPGLPARRTVAGAGQFSTRGGILDVWPAAEPYPVRLEFFGDEIDTLRRFDPATQRTVRNPRTGCWSPRPARCCPARPRRLTPRRRGPGRILPAPGAHHARQPAGLPAAKCIGAGG